MHILTLGRSYREKYGEIQTNFPYQDFIVSGKSMGKLFNLPKLDLIGVFGWQNNEYENRQIDEFLGLEKPELETGRTSFYICPECGDIGCGAITAKIEFTDQNVIWKDFAYENNYSEPDLSNYRKIEPFIFDRIAYFETFELLRIPVKKRKSFK